MTILADYLVLRNLTFTVGEHRFGFMDAQQSFGGDVTLCFAGPFGGFPVPCSAVQGWTLIALLVSLLFAGAAWTLCRRRRTTESL